MIKISFLIKPLTEYFEFFNFYDVFFCFLITKIRVIIIPSFLGLHKIVRKNDHFGGKLSLNTYDKFKVRQTFIVLF